MITSKDVMITREGRILVNGTEKGFLDDETVYMFVNDRSVKVCDYDHRSEAVAIVVDFLNMRQEFTRH